MTTSSTQVPASPQDVRILIVDDQRGNVAVLELMLRHFGWTNLRSTTNPHEAVPLYAEFRPDLILLDLVMPELDGFQVLELLTPLIPPGTYLPIVVITGDETPETRRRALGLGASDFVNKPFDQEEVRLRITNLLSMRSLAVRLQQRTAEVEVAHTELEQAFRLLARYFSPQVIQVILQGADDGTTSGTGNRRELTVLFADLRDFTAISERITPEETLHLLNDYFTAMAAEIFRVDGTVDKYIGDGLMAVFGDPVAYPDHVDRAFEAAFAMQQRMRELQAVWQSEGRAVVGMGIGIAAGYAIVGNTGSPDRMDYTAIGGTVNIASRLSDLARPGEILTTRKTHWRVQQIVEGVLREPIPVKGFAHQVEIVAALGPRVGGATPSPAGNSDWIELVSRLKGDPGFRSRVANSSPVVKPGRDAQQEREGRVAQQIARLLGSPFFRNTSAQEIAFLTEAAAVEEHPSGALIVHQGGREDTFYLICSGTVSVSVLDSAGSEPQVAALTEGDHFGEVALLFDVPRTANVRTTSPCTFLVLHEEAFLNALSRTPLLYQGIQAVAGLRLLATTARGAWK